MAVTITNDAATTRTNLGLGDAATKTVGTAAGNIPVLDGSGKLPAVSGENLTGIVALPTGGSVGQVVTNTSSGAGNWQTPAAGGKILQVVQSVYTSHWSTSSSNLSDTPLSVSLTPSSTSSKILVRYTIPVGGSSWNYSSTQLMRGSTSIATGTSVSGIQYQSTTGHRNYEDHQTYIHSTEYLDSPSTTSSITYKVQMRASGTAYINRTYATGDPISTTISTLTVMEIGA